jgi:hypothetical protein
MPTLPEVGSTIKSLADPEAVGGMGGGMVAGPLGAGAGAAAGNIINQEYNRMRNPQVGAGIPDLTPAAGAFFTGMAAEGISSGLAGSVRRPMTPAGEMASNYFGRSKMGAHQLTDSPLLDFMGNVARYGPGGKQIMTDAEREQSTVALEKLRNASHTFSPSITIDPATQEFDKGLAGKQVQTDVQGQIKNMRATSGYPEFSQKYGESRQIIPQIDPVTGAPLTNMETGEPIVKKGPTVDTLQSKRSEALKNSRSAYAAGDVKAQSDYLGQAEKHMKGINKALPDDAARNEYRAIADKYAAESSRLDNPTVQTIRKGPSDDVIDNVIDGKLKNYAPMNTQVGQTDKELLGKIQSAASPKAWAQMQADTIHRLGQRSIDAKTGMVDVKTMKDMIDGMDNGVKNSLFGNQLPAINQTIKALTQAGKYKESEAGRLFIAIRTGQAGIKAATVAGSVIAAPFVAGYETGHPMAGAAGSAAVLISPYVFAKLLTSEVGRTLLTRAAKGGMTASAMGQTRKAILRFATQQAAASSVEAFSPESDPNQDQGAAAYKPENYIPEPPK